ncbi:MAG: TIGR00725 family protein [Candidatus Thorarchaeota archaeon]
MEFNFKDNFKGIISIIGASEIDNKTKKLTIELGRLLAENKYAIVCGGLTGVMESICRGVKENGGLTIGVIPFIEKSAANRYVDIVIPVPFSQARNIVVVLTGDVCVAIGGKAGTLSELCFAWIYQKPIIALSNIQGWSSKVSNQKLDDRRSDKIYGLETPGQVIEKIDELFDSNIKLNQNVKNKF